MLLILLIGLGVLNIKGYSTFFIDGVWGMLDITRALDRRLSDSVDNALIFSR